MKADLRKYRTRHGGSNLNRFGVLIITFHVLPLVIDPKNPRPGAPTRMGEIARTRAPFKLLASG